MVVDLWRVNNMIEKIDINKIRGRWSESHEVKNGNGSGSTFIQSGGDDTIKSMQLLGQKINEIIDSLTNNK